MIRCISTIVPISACSPPPGAPARSSPCIARTTRRSAGAAAALLAAGNTGPKYHAWSRPRIIEREATHRAIALAELVDQPIQVFHVSCAEVAEEIARAQARGLKVWGETCTQYFVLTQDHMDRPGFEGAKFMCSPSPRGREDHAKLWDVIRRGTLDIVSSDHSGMALRRPARQARQRRQRAVHRKSPTACPASPPGCR